MECRLSDFNFEFPKELIASRTAGKGKTHILYCRRLYQPSDGGSVGFRQCRLRETSQRLHQRILPLAALHASGSGNGEEMAV